MVRIIPSPKPDGSPVLTGTSENKSGAKYIGFRPDEQPDAKDC